LSEELTEWKLDCPDPSPEAFIFASQSGGFLDASNFRHRVLGKLERELGLPKLTFQVIRRTTATLAQKMGTVKDVQGLLRHSRTATTTDVYMQEIPEGVRATVDSFHRELKADSATRPKNRSRGMSIRRQEQGNPAANVGKGIKSELSAQNSASREEGFQDLLPNATNQPVCKSVSY